MVFSSPPHFNSNSSQLLSESVLKKIVQHQSKKPHKVKVAKVRKNIFNKKLVLINDDASRDMIEKQFKGVVLEMPQDGDDDSNMELQH